MTIVHILNITMIVSVRPWGPTNLFAVTIFTLTLVTVAIKYLRERLLNVWIMPGWLFLLHLLCVFASIKICELFHLAASILESASVLSAKLIFLSPFAVYSNYIKDFFATARAFKFPLAFNSAAPAQAPIYF